MITTLLIAAGALYLLNRKQSGANGIGKVERIKRRIYKEVSLAQSAGVDFSKKYAELSKDELDALEHIGKDVVMWKQSKRSIESGKPYTESYYGSLRRAWNAVSGIQGIGATDYPVYDRDGNVCLTWTDVTEHIEHEPEAKTLLALPPHIEEKKKKRTPKAEDDYARRFQFAQAILDAENNRNTEDGFAREDLNDIRIALLDKAKHMHVGVPYDLRDQYEDLIENNYIRGDNRYKALELISWILWVHQKYERGGDTYYPMYSFASKEDALLQTGGKMSGRGFKIIPVWDVPIEKITGIL